MKYSIKKLWAVLVLCSCFSSVAATKSFADTSNTTLYHGFNFPQATFGQVPGVPNKDYMWQKPSDVDMYEDLGANIFRVGFLWERMQPLLNMPLDQRELAQLDALVAEAAKRKALVLLDVHNYGGYKQQLIGSENIPDEAFEDLWTRLATHYKGNPSVAFGLMNEPVKQTADEWADIAQKAIIAIRKTGADQQIFVPGTAWSGAHSWLYKVGEHSNGEALANLTDPLHNLIFEAHEYFDVDSSGTHDACVSENIGVQRLADFTGWLNKTHNKGFLGEFGASKDSLCVEALKETLAYMAKNNNVWIGWSYWAAAAWFGSYRFNVYPPATDQFPQLAILKAAM